MSKPRLKKFLSYYKPYLGLFSRVMLCALLVAGIALVLPLLTRYITGPVLEGGLPNAARQIALAGGAMLLLIILHTACNYYVDYYGHSMGAMMETDLRAELFDHYQKLSFRFYDGQKTGQLMSRLTNDLLSLAELYHHGPEDYLIYLLKFSGAFIILLTIDVPLTLAIAAFLPLMALFSLYFNRKLRGIFKDNRERIAGINAQVEDTLAGIRVVKSFTNEAVERGKFNVENHRFLHSRRAFYQNESFLYQGMLALSQLVTVTVVVFGGLRILNGSLSLADLIVFLLYTGSIIEPVQKINHITEQFQEGMAAFDRFMEIIEIEPDIQDAPHARDLGHVRGSVSFIDVGFRYNENHTHILKNLSLEVAAGESIALVGSSGVGKTTLCSLIPRFYEVNEGQILLDGINIKDVTLRSLRQNVGVVQQDVYLFAGTVYENIRYGKMDATPDEIMAAAKLANAHDFIMGLPDGYDTDIGQRGVKLSGGQKQRLSIARVFLKNPPVLIFDEATSALDYESEKVVQESLEALAKDRTTFIIAHRLSTIRNARRIVVLTERGIQEQGTHEALMALDGAYAHFYRMQFKPAVGAVYVGAAR